VIACSYIAKIRCITYRFDNRVVSDWVQRNLKGCYVLRFTDRRVNKPYGFQSSEASLAGAKSVLPDARQTNGLSLTLRCATFGSGCWVVLYIALSIVAIMLKRKNIVNRLLVTLFQFISTLNKRVKVY